MLEVPLTAVWHRGAPRLGLSPGFAAETARAVAANGSAPQTAARKRAAVSVRYRGCLGRPSCEKRMRAEPMALRAAWVVSHEVSLQFVVVGAEVRI